MAKCDAVDLPELEQTFWAYLAAFIDGEGSVTMCQNGPRLVVSNTHLPTLEWIKDSLGCGYIQANGKSKTKQCYNLSFGSNSIRSILPKTIPYMRIKRQRSQILIDYLLTVVPRGGDYHKSFDDERSKIRDLMMVEG